MISDQLSNFFLPVCIVDLDFDILLEFVTTEKFDSKYDSAYFKKNKPENPFQNYDVAKKILKPNHDFSLSLRKKKNFKEKTGKFWKNQKPDIISPGNLCL